LWERLTRVRLEQKERVVREGIVGEVEIRGEIDPVKLL